MRIDLSDQHPFDGFRSRLEVEIAAELDRLEIHHSYEVPWTDPETGYVPRYLPDFTIERTPRTDELRLPLWIEGKPQQFIYDLFGTLGLERRVGQHFAEDVHIVGYGAQRLKDMHVEELWKPKALAEMSGEGVLICGAVGATNRLSVEMRPEEMVFSRTHPFVNQRGVEQRQRRDEQRAEAERLRQKWLTEQTRREHNPTAVRATNSDNIRLVKSAAQRTIVPRFASVCAGCQAHGIDGKAHLCSLIGGGERWFRLCEQCLAVT